MWAAVPTLATGGKREAVMVRDFSEVPRDAERVDLHPAGGGRMTAAVATALAIVCVVARGDRVRARSRARRARSAEAAGPAPPTPPSRPRSGPASCGPSGGPRSSSPTSSAPRRSRRTGRSGSCTATAARDGDIAYGYLIYPHKPIVSFDAATGELLNEHCVSFPDRCEPEGGQRLPDADDVLAKWMALRADERGLINEANMHLPGRQLDPDHVRRDLARLSEWTSRSSQLSMEQ